MYTGHFLHTDRFLIGAHRGAQSLFPENTIHSFAKAIEIGSDFIELDVLFSKDKKVVIHHDFHRENFLIADLTLEQLKKFDVGSKPNPKFPKQQSSRFAKIPLLEELFEYVMRLNTVNAKKIGFNIEIKSDPKHPEFTRDLEEFVYHIIKIVQKYCLDHRVYFSSFDLDAIRCVKKQSPKSILGVLFEQNPGSLWVDDLILQCKNIQASVASPCDNLLDASNVNLLKMEHLKIIPWTINDPDRVTLLKKWGVSGIITDYPQSFAIDS